MRFMEIFFLLWPLVILVGDSYGFICVLFSMDPTYYFINLFAFSITSHILSHPTVFIFRIFHTVTVYHLGFSMIAAAIMLSVFILYIASNCFFQLKMWAAFHSGKLVIIQGKVQEPTRFGSDRNKIPSRTNLLNLHTETKLLETITNQVYYITIPFFLLCGLTLLLATNYATIRMHAIIPMPYYLLNPLGSVIIIFGIVVLMPPASNVYEDSLLFIQQMRVLCFCNKNLVRRVKSQQPFRLNIGPICMVKRSTLTHLIAVVIDFTVDTILI